MASRRTYQILLVACLAGLALVIGLAAVLLLYEDVPDDTPARPGRKITERMPEFSLALLGGGKLTHAELRGKPVLVNFFASWCLPCREEMPAIEKLSKEYRPKDVVFFGVAVDDTETKMKEFVTRFGVSFSVGLDDGGSVQKAFGVYGLPTTFFIDRQGQIRYFHAGAVNEQLLRHELDKLL